MTTKYLLPCECGNQVAVDATQAGLTVHCTCGKELQVPTMRGLSRCERATEEVEQPSGDWSTGKGLILLGTIVLLLGIVGTVYAWQVAEFNQNLDFTLRVDYEAHRKDVEVMSPSELWIEWVRMPRSIETMPVEDDSLGARAHERMRDQFVSRYRRFIWLGVGVSVIGAALAAFGAVLTYRKPRRI